jgi:predicted nuclease with TOPRIM domain
MQNVENYYGEIITAFMAWLTTSAWNWFANRKVSEVEMVERIATIWRENTERYEVKLKEMMAEMDTIREDLNTLREENRSLKSENTRLKKDVEKLTTRIKELESNHGQ